MSTPTPGTPLKWKIAQWFELRWWKNYLRGKNKEEYLNWKQNYWFGILSKIFKEPGSTLKSQTYFALEVFEVAYGDKTICDLGCGPAGIFIALPSGKVTAVDPLIDAYEKETSFFKKADYPKTTFVKSTIEEFNPPQVFDIVFCMNAINHVYDIEKGFEKLKQVCAPNGTVLVSIDAHNYSFFKHLFRLIPGDVLHPHQYDLEEYKALIEKQGLKILKTELLKKEGVFNHYLLMTAA